MIEEIVALIALAVLTVFAFTQFIAVRVAVFIAIFIALGWLFFKFFVKQYDEYQRAIILRMGKFNRIAGPGWSIVLPFFEKEFQLLDVRVKSIEMFIPVVFTQDDLRLKIDGSVYYSIVDPSKAVLKIDNYMTGLMDMIQSEARNIMAKMTMRDLFSKLDDLNNILLDAIKHKAWVWGIDISMVQIRGIMPPDEIAVAMQEKEIASQFLQAERFKAEAQKVVIEALGQGAQGLNDKAIMYIYVKALEAMSQGSATKIILPMQMTQMLDSLGQGVGLGTGMDISGAIDTVKNTIAKG